MKASHGTIIILCIYLTAYLNIFFSVFSDGFLQSNITKFCGVRVSNLTSQQTASLAYSGFSFGPEFGRENCLLR